MKKLGTAVLLAFLSIAAPAVAQDMKGTTEGTTKDFQPTGEFKGMAQEQKLLHVEEASDPDSREQETRQTIRQNCVAENVDAAVCDRITGLDINKAPNK
jgi:ABC-type sugar transport system substrate-binding protein